MKKLVKLIEKTGFEIINRKKATNTSSYYLEICYEDLFLTIRYADHSDCYATSDINVAVQNSKNLDGISFELLREKLEKLVKEIDEHIVYEYFDEDVTYGDTSKLQKSIMYNITKIDTSISARAFAKTERSQILAHYRALDSSYVYKFKVLN